MSRKAVTKELLAQMKASGLGSATMTVPAAEFDATVDYFTNHLGGVPWEKKPHEYSSAHMRDGGPVLLTYRSQAFSVEGMTVHVTASAVEVPLVPASAAA